MLSREWRRSWSSADRRYSNYIWVVNNYTAYKGVLYYIFYGKSVISSKQHSTNDKVIKLNNAYTKFVICDFQDNNKEDTKAPHCLPPVVSNAENISESINPRIIVNEICIKHIDIDYRDFDFFSVCISYSLTAESIKTIWNACKDMCLYLMQLWISDSYPWLLFHLIPSIVFSHSGPRAVLVNKSV